MFLIQEILMVANNRQSEAVKRLEWIHGLMQQHPGFTNAQVARYLGNVTQYLILRGWQDAASFDAFRQTPDGQGYSKNRPEGLYEGAPVGRRWDMVIESTGEASGDFLSRSVYKVADGRWDEFAENRRGHDKLALQVPGIQYLRHYRCTDEDPEYKDTSLLLTRRTDRDAYNALLESPQALEYRNGTPRGLFQSQVTECYEIVSDIYPARQ